MIEKLLEPCWWLYHTTHAEQNNSYYCICFNIIIHIATSVLLLYKAIAKLWMLAHQQNVFIAYVRNASITFKILTHFIRCSFHKKRNFFINCKTKFCEMWKFKCFSGFELEFFLLNKCPLESKQRMNLCFWSKTLLIIKNPSLCTIYRTRSRVTQHSLIPMWGEIWRTLNRNETELQPLALRWR